MVDSCAGFDEGMELGGGEVAVSWGVFEECHVDDWSCGWICISGFWFGVG